MHSSRSKVAVTSFSEMIEIDVKMFWKNKAEREYFKMFFRVWSLSKHRKHFSRNENGQRIGKVLN